MIFFRHMGWRNMSEIAIQKYWVEEELYVYVFIFLLGVV